MGGLPNLKDIFAEESLVGLSNLQFLKVSWCKSLSTVIHSTSLAKIHKLQTLIVECCDSVQEIFCLDKLGIGVNVETLTELNTIKIERLPCLRRIWSKNPCGIMRFQNIQKLEVGSCNNLEFLFFPSMVQSLAQLRELEVRNCKKMEAIIMEEEGSGIETSETLVFSMLTNLTIENLESLTCFSRTKCSRKACSDNRVKSCSTALFNQEVSIPSLESLRMDGLPNLEDIFAEESLVGLSNLQFLKVSSCKSLSTVIHSTSLAKIHKLQTLTVTDCDSVQEIFYLDKLGIGVNVETLTELNTIKIDRLPCLRRIWSKNPCGIMRFQNIKKLEVDNCGNLEFLFLTSMVHSFAQLRELKVRNCKKMEAIIMEEEGSGIETSKTLVFSMLTSLTIQNLESLTCFSRTKCSLDARSDNRIESCSTALFNQEFSFSFLESLTMDGLPNLEDIFAKESPLELSNLQFLKVSSCKSLSTVINSTSLVKLPKLQTLTVEACNSVEEIFSLDELGFGVNVETLTKLNTIEIERLPCLRRIWSKNPCGIMRFQNIKKLGVKSCNNLEFLFFPSMVQSLAQLRELEVRNCKKMEAIIMEEEGLGIETSKTLVFSMLTSLTIQNLESLTCFSRTKCSLEARSDNRIKSCSTALFNQEVSIPSLESLTISELPNLEDIFAEESLVGLSNLQFLSVYSCKSLSTVIHSASLVKLHKLQTLTVGFCDSVQEIFCLDEQGAGVNVDTLIELNTINIWSLPSLRCIWSENPCGILKFLNLKELKVASCGNLEFLFLPSMVQSLAQLRELEVYKCKRMEVIIMEEEGSGIETSEPLVFSMLTNLTIKYLESLTCFSCTKCPREARDEDCVKSCSTILFNQEIAFPSLETLDICRVDKIEMLWDNQVAADSFRKLKSLSVNYCKKLVNIIPSCILGRLRSLESLEVTSCGSLEVVFKIQPLSPPDGDPVAHFPLKKLQLDDLPKLKCVWDKEIHSRVKFQFLRSVTVSKCKSLTALFPTSVAVQLTHLEELRIYDCGIVEVIEKEGLVAREVFPRLTSLKLEHLAELTCIYARTHALHWPALKTLEMDGCDKVEILASQPENEMPVHRQPFFLIEKGAFPNLEELKLDLCGRMEIWHEHFHDGEFFCKLRVLKLYHLSEESIISTRNFVQSLTNLEELVVYESYLEKLSTIMGAKEGASLEGKVILPLSRFFQHLKTLDVSCCDELSNMFTPTIAGNLVELTKLRIRNCKMLTEVIRDGGGEEGLVVAFNQLKYMELDGLTKLRCFSSIRYTLKFPLLEDVIVSKCPNMKFFSEGLIEAPKLEKVRGSKETWFSKENLNIIIQNMFEEMAAMSQVESMLLSEFPELIGKWHSKLSPINSSWQLKSLTVDKCPFTSAISSGLMLLLKNMKRLQVCDCESLKEIFDLEGLGDVSNTRVLPCFNTLDLVNLPELRQLWNKDLQGSLTYDCLHHLTLYHCSDLRHAFAPSMARCLPQLWSIKIKECGQMEGVIAEEEAQGSAVENIIFPRLLRIELECLPNLTSFLSGKNQTLECPFLRWLTIAHCPKMRCWIGQSLMEIDQSSPPLFTPPVHFPRLRSIDLSHMDNLSQVWTTSPQDTLTFEFLRIVKVENCKNLENLFPHWVATSLIKLENLRVESCGLEEIVASGDDTSDSTTGEFLFPQLTSLMFNDMPQLKSFCTKLSTLNWPRLKELWVTHCDKLSMLSFAASMNKGAQREDQHDLSDHEAHFPFEMGIPERFSLVNEDIQMIHNGKFSDDIFGKLQALILACFHDENAVFPSRFLLQRCQNLQSVEVFCSSFEDIFPDEGLIDEGKHLVFENLKELKLSKLHNLKHVWREDSLVSKILQSIETFEIWDCPGLTTLFPTVTSFQNLKKLVVKNSSGLINLITVSAVMNLAHLTELTIIGCERMKEVVEDDENGEEKVIFFRKLERLTLQQLPSLECFSSTTSCSFRFPFLRNIEVEECPKMKIFSKVRLSTPNLMVVRLFRYKWEWNWEGGDLNTTIQKLSA